MENKKQIVISTDMEEFGVVVTIDGRSITKHFEVDMEKAIEKLLRSFDICKEQYEIIDNR